MAIRVRYSTRRVQGVPSPRNAYFGRPGATGNTGATGATGAAGPNLVSSTTSTDLTGYLKGNGSTVTAVTPIPESDIDAAIARDSEVTSAINALDAAIAAALALKADLVTGKVPSSQLPIASAGALGAIRVGSNLSIDGSGVLSGVAAVSSAALDTAFGDARGSILRRGASGWELLTPGTNGQYLQTQGSGADTIWSTVNGMAIGGTVTGATAGRVLYVGTGPVLAQSDNFQFDGSTLKVRVPASANAIELVDASDPAKKIFQLKPITITDYDGGSAKTVEMYFRTHSDSSGRPIILTPISQGLRLTGGTGATARLEQQGSYRNDVGYSTSTTGNAIGLFAASGFGGLMMDNERLTLVQFRLTNDEYDLGGHLGWRMATAKSGVKYDAMFAGWDRIVWYLPTQNFPAATTDVTQKFKRIASQTGDMTHWLDESNNVLSRIYASGAFQPVSLADASAPNNSVYYSTTQSKLVYKDSGGTVNNLY